MLALLRVVAGGGRVGYASGMRLAVVSLALVALSLHGCSSSHGPSSARRIATADASGGGPAATSDHSPAASRDDASLGNSSRLSADSGATDANSSRDVSGDAATTDAAPAQRDAGGAGDASVPAYRLCPFKDSCSTRQGPNCPAASPSGACDAPYSCFYCSQFATANADTEIYCYNGKWSQTTPQGCRP